MKLSLRRLAAESLALIDYRRFKAIYWRLRARDIQTRYAYRDDYPTLKAIIESRRIRSIADVGCGDGRLFPLYKECRVEHLFAVEMSVPLHRAAQQRIGRGEAPADSTLVLGDVGAADRVLPQCDLVLASRVLQHVPPEEVERIVEKMARAARKAVYLNEMLADKPLASHIFLHDYDALFGRHGFAVAETGRIAGVGYEYRLYEKRG